MNQKNGKNSLGLDHCFEELDNPIDLFKKWFSEGLKRKKSTTQTLLLWQPRMKAISQM